MAVEANLIYQNPFSLRVSLLVSLLIDKTIELLKL